MKSCTIQLQISCKWWEKKCYLCHQLETPYIFLSICICTFNLCLFKRSTVELDNFWDFGQIILEKITNIYWTLQLFSTFKLDVPGRYALTRTALVMKLLLLFWLSVAYEFSLFVCFLLDWFQWKSFMFQTMSDFITDCLDLLVWFDLIF